MSPIASRVLPAILFAAALPTQQGETQQGKTQQGKTQQVSPSLRERLAPVFFGKAEVDHLEVNGERVELADIGQDLTVDTPRERMQEFLLRIVELDLRRQGVWLDDGAFEAAYAKYAQPYDSTPFSVAVIAKQFKGFPDLASYKRRWRAIASFERMIADEIDEQALARELVDNQMLFGDGRVSCELWFHPCEQGEEWSHEVARSLAQRTKDRLDSVESGAVPEIDAEFSESGVVGTNQLRKLLGELEYAELFADDGVSERIMNAAKGAVVGPLSTVDGYWVARIQSRSEGAVTKPTARNLELARTILVTRRFYDYVGELLARTVLRVPQR